MFATTHANVDSSAWTRVLARWAVALFATILIPGMLGKGSDLLIGANSRSSCSLPACLHGVL